MPHIVEDRVLESTTSTGTGALALAAAVTGFRRFSAVCAVADTAPYFIEAIDSLGQPTGDYEYGIGTYSAANTLTRAAVPLGSSNAGAPVNFAAGSKNVGITVLASEFNGKAALASPTFTGAPTAPNAALGVRGTRLATMESFNTEFVKSLASSGYQKLPGGLIVQWGNVVVGTAGIDNTLVLPIAFPNFALSVSITPNSVGGSGGSVSVQDAWPKATASTILFRPSVVGNHIFMALGY